MAAFVILNPYSSRWKALERKPDIERALRDAGIKAEWALTEKPGDAQRLAARAVQQGFTPILAAGGDGTISEVVNGMMDAARNDQPLPPVGFFPVGTANDLVDNLGLPRDIQEMARIIAAGKTRKMDLCQVNDRYFINNAGLGLEPYITILQSKMKRLQGNLRYIVAALQGIMHKPEWEMKLEWENGSYEGPITLISVGNCPRTGGVFYTVPHADPFDGRLSFVYAFLPTRGRILRALPMTMKPGRGNITEHPAVHEVHTTWLKVQAHSPTPAHADGELISDSMSELHYRVYPQQVEVLMPLD